MPTNIYTVYKTTNTINNKIYIGVHKTTNPNDSYLGSGKAIKLAIKLAIMKYGKENFIKEILFEFDNLTNMFDKEREIVNRDFIGRNDTYNMCRGGRIINYEANINRVKSIETRKKLSIANTGKVHLESTKLKLSILNSGKNNPQFSGYYITPIGKFIVIKDINIDLLSPRTIYEWCKNPDKIITTYSFGCSKYLKSLKDNPIGKSRRDLGFWFEPIL